MEHFDGSLGAKVNMFTKVDLGEATFPQEADQPIVAKLVTNTISHRLLLSGKRSLLDSLSSGDECLSKHRTPSGTSLIVPHLLNDDIRQPSHGTILGHNTVRVSAIRRITMPRPCSCIGDANRVIGTSPRPHCHQNSST